MTVIAQESLPPGVDLTQVRRNVLTSGPAVDDLVGRVPVLDSGAGPVRLRVATRAHPCAWMDVTVGPGAWKSLRGRGGIRCEPLTGGLLRVGRLAVTVEA